MDALPYVVAVLGSALLLTARLVPEGSSRSFCDSHFFVRRRHGRARGGWKPGVLTTVLSLCVATLFLVRPYYTFRVASTGDVLRITASVLVGVAISIFCEALHRAWGRIEDRQQRLERALQQLQIVTDSMSASIVHCSRDMKYRWVSRPYADWIGLPPEQIAGRPIVDIVGSEAFEQLRPRFEQVLAGRKVQYEEVIDVKRLGRRWINAVYSPTLDAGGVPDGWVGVIVDNTDRRQMEEALRRSEQCFAHFMQFLPGSAWIKDLEGRYVYANDAAEAIFNRRRDALYGKCDGEVFPNQSAAQFAENDRQALTSENGVQVVETLEHADGIVHHSLVSKFPIPGSNGTPAFVGGIAIDITDRLQAEKVRAESEERFRQLAETINEVFWMVDVAAPRILYISPAYERIWGRTCESLYADPLAFLDAVHPDDRERVQVSVAERQGRGESNDEEYRIVKPDGSVRWIRNRAFPVKDAEGQVFRMAGIAEDITDRKHAEDALRDADRRKDEFLATLAHELRNPLAPICNAVELMQFAQSNATVMDEARNVLKRQLGHLVRLIDDLLEISRITRGKLQLRKDASSSPRPCARGRSNAPARRRPRTRADD